jgi:perosamine synthetase
VVTTARLPHLPLIRPDIAFEDVAEDLRTVFASGMLTRGPFLEQFEAAFADRVGAAHAVAVTSATTALHLALVAHGIGPGDEVLVSDFTFPASGNVIVQAGATPVLVDCLPGRFELDPDHAASLVTPRTAAVLPVDPFGRPADMPAVTELASRHGLFVLEDAACAVGSSLAGRPCGSWPGAAAFSFHPRKLLTTGEGGAVTTSDGDLAERMRLLRSHGAVAGSDGLSFVDFGFNYRMSEMQAVMGLAQLRRLDAIVADRQGTATSYVQLLADVPHVTVPAIPAGAEVNHQSFVVLLDEDVDRERVRRSMAADGIETTLGTYAMHAHPAFGELLGFSPGALPHSWAAQQRSLTLPLVPRMEREDVERVITSLRTAVGA